MTSARTKELSRRDFLRFSATGAALTSASGWFDLLAAHAAGSAVKGGSFPERVVIRARAGAPLRVVDDQRLNPTYTGDLARAALDLSAQGLEGVVHVVADGCCSFWDLAVEALRLAGAGREVARITTAALDAPAARPANGCLASDRVRPLRHWREALAAWWSELGEP